jgi:hypothetical protein
MQGQRRPEQPPRVPGGGCAAAGAGRRAAGPGRAAERAAGGGARSGPRGAGQSRPPRRHGPQERDFIARTISRRRATMPWHGAAPVVLLVAATWLAAAAAQGEPRRGRGNGAKDGVSRPSSAARPAARGRRPPRRAPAADRRLRAPRPPRRAAGKPRRGEPGALHCMRAAPRPACMPQHPPLLLPHPPAQCDCRAAKGGPVCAG